MNDLHTTLGANLIDYALKTRAHDTRAIVTRTSTRRYRISPYARLITVLTAPADQAGIWAVAQSTPGAAPTIHATGDPSTWDGQHHIFDALGQNWAQWLKTTLENNELPQIILADTAALNALTWAAKKTARNPKISDNARFAAHYIITAAHQHRVAGDQSIITLTEALKEHYTTCYDATEETYLGTWVDHPNLNPNDPTGNHRRPINTLDEETTAATAPLGRAWDKMNTKEGDDRIARAARLIPLITPHLTSRHNDLAAALNLLTRHPGNELPTIRDTWKNSVEAAARFYTNGYTPSLRHLPATIDTLNTREKAVEYWQRSLWYYDQLEQLRGSATGHLIAGNGNGATLRANGPVRARPGDTFINPADPTAATLTVENLHTDPAGGTIVTFERGNLTGQTLLVPSLNKPRPSRWVKPGWVHTGNIPPAGEAVKPPAGESWLSWAEGLKG